jgi:ABC-2 type transport system permease protein
MNRMNWQKVAIVARREYWTNFKRPSFLFMAFLFPVLIVGSMFFVTRFLVNRENNTDAFQDVGYVDSAGVINPNTEIPEGYVLLDVPAVEMEQYIQEQIESGTLDAVLIIDESYPFTGHVDLYTEANPSEAFLDDIDEFLSENLATQLEQGESQIPTERLVEPFDPVYRNFETDERQSTAALIGRFLLPTLFVFVFFIATSATSQFMMGGVVEEKENRLMEILAYSVRPIELLGGKLLGLSGLAFTQIGLWVLAGGIIAATTKQAQDFFAGAEFQAGDILLMVVLFVLDFFLTAAVMLAIGAATTAESESRQVAGFVGFIGVLPIAANFLFFTNPNGPIPVIMSLFPLTAPVAIIMRIGLTEVPLWQIGVSMVILILSTIGVLWLAAVVFRLGMLMYGKVLTPKLLWHAIRQRESVPVIEALPE